MHMSGELQAAIHGKAAVLKRIPFLELKPQAAEREEDLDAFIRQFQEGAADLRSSGETEETLEADSIFDGALVEMDFLSAVAKTCPEAEIAVIAQVQYDTADESDPEWASSYSPAGSASLEWWETVESDRVCAPRPDGGLYQFTYAELGEALAEGDGSLSAEDWATELTEVGLDLVRSADGVWSVIEDAGDVRAEELPEGVAYLDEEGNQYFPWLAWRHRLTRSDWGFPEDADWIPFDLEIEPAKDGGWDEDE